MTYGIVKLAHLMYLCNIYYYFLFNVCCGPLSGPCRQIPLPRKNPHGKTFGSLCWAYASRALPVLTHYIWLPLCLFLRSQKVSITSPIPPPFRMAENLLYFPLLFPLLPGTAPGSQSG